MFVPDTSRCMPSGLLLGRKEGEGGREGGREKEREGGRDGGKGRLQCSRFHRLVQMKWGLTEALAMQKAGVGLSADSLQPACRLEWPTLALHFMVTISQAVGQHQPRTPVAISRVHQAASLLDSSSSLLSHAALQAYICR